MSSPSGNNGPHGPSHATLSAREPEPCETPQRPQKAFLEALDDFMSMAACRSQHSVIRMFLDQVITHSDLCDQGSVLIHRRPKDALDDGVLVVTAGANNVNNVNANSIDAIGDVELDVHEGVAGLAFRKRAPEFAADTSRHPHFKVIAGQDIATIYCVPILLDDRGEPFGVVAFHNGEHGGEITEHKRRAMDVAVKSLQCMLALSPRRLVSRERVFVVHGRNDGVRAELASILDAYGVEAVVIQSLARTGQDLLSFLEDQIRDCVAGFVLLTPDDEGRLYAFGEPLRQRARQNVIFEGGYLTALFRNTQRVCFLQRGDLEIPSDLNGLLMERFHERIEPERIFLTLRQWGLKPKGDGQGTGDGRIRGGDGDRAGSPNGAPREPLDD